MPVFSRIATRMKPLNPTEGTPIRSRHWLQPVAIAVIALGQVACAQTPTQAVATPSAQPLPLPLPRPRPLCNWLPTLSVHRPQRKYL